MRSALTVLLVLAIAGTARTEWLRVRVVDAESGKPVRGVQIKRWASQWQPRILMLPGKFWFPEGSVATDAKGTATIDNTARDDWYALEAVGYETGRIERSWGKYQFLPQASKMPHRLMTREGWLVVPLHRSMPMSERQPGRE